MKGIKRTVIVSRSRFCYRFTGPKSYRGHNDKIAYAGSVNIEKKGKKKIRFFPYVVMFML